MVFNIAIDGPAGAGKSTVAKQLAKRLSFVYVDTGAMYRAMALYFLRNGISPDDEQAVTAACSGANVEIENRDGEQLVFLNGENVNGYIRTEEVSNMTSATSVYPGVRERLTSLQQELAAKTDVVMDGRDIGTCVLPDAQVKIYLTASVKTRAKRRYDELRAKGGDAELAQIEADIEKRDYRDMHRDIAPLKQADDAILVDSSEMGISEVVDTIYNIYKKAAL